MDDRTCPPASTDVSSTTVGQIEPLQAPQAPQTPQARPAREPAAAGGGLWSRSFRGLVITQFLGALNDNMFRWLLLPIGKDLVTTLGVREDLALSAGSVVFLAPFVLLAAPAGYLADRFSKRGVIVGCKVAEIVVMAFGVAVILSGDIRLMGLVLFMMGAQSAIFSPSKLGSIPEMVRPDRISAANGVIAMTTMFAIILGGMAGGLLYTLTTPAGTALGPGQHCWWISAAALIGVAMAGWAASLWIGPLSAANPARQLPRNPAAQTVRDLRSLAGNRPLFLAALGIAFFWSLGALCQINVDKFAQFELFVEQQYVGPLLAVLVLGIGFGSMLAGIWSRGRIELGIVPLGAAGIAAGAMLLGTVPGASAGNPGGQAYGWTCAWLLVLGVAAGLYEIPLQSFLQHRSPAASRGSILAAANFLSFSGMLMASALFWLLGAVWGLSARQIFVVAGLLAVPALGVALWLLPGATARVVFGVLLRLIYRLRVTGLQNVPAQGGALLTPNHVSWIDGILLLVVCRRPIRMVAHADYVDAWWIRRLARDVGVIPIRTGRKSAARTIRLAREALRRGELVCIFPEAALTRSGRIGSFHPGFLSILKGTGAPVVPVHLGGLWGSIFSYERGRLFWKWPRRWPARVSIRFGRPIHEVAGVEQLRAAVEQLGE